MSSKKQASEDRYSLAAQSRAMHECCERKSIVIVDELVEPGRSAFTHDITRLPALHEALLRVEAGEANAIVMHETSRLARNEQLGNHVLDRLSACGASFINSTNDIDYTTPEGRSFYNNEVSMHAYSSRKTSEHAKKGKNEQFLNGLQVGPMPFGYVAQRNAEGASDRSLPGVVVPEEAAAVCKAFDDYLLGKKAPAIAREWNALGFKPRSVKGIDRFQHQTVRNILENPFYCGYVTHLDDRRKGRHDPIIDEETFWKAQMPRRKMVRRQHPPALVQGIATCAACQHSVYVIHVRRSAKNHDLLHHYYREPSRDFNLDCAHGGKLWRMDEVDDQVDEVIRSLMVAGDWLEFVQREARKVPDGSAEQRKELKARFDRAQSEFIAGRLPDAAWARMADELTR